MESLLLAENTCPKLESYGVNQLRRRLRIASKKDSDFWVLYCTQVNTNSLVTPFAEILPRQHPVVVSFTISCKKPDAIGEYNDELYASSFIDLAVLSVQSALTATIGEYAATCIVVVSKVYIDDDDKESIHVNYKVHFPLCRIENNYQEKYLYPALLTSFRKNNVLSSLNIELQNTKPADVLQPINADMTIPIYGSSPFGDNRAAPYVTFIYDNKGRLVDDWSQYEEIFAVKEHNAMRRVANTSQNSLRFWLPVILSAEWQGGEEYSPKKVEERLTGEEIEEDESVRTTDQSTAIEMLTMIHPSYAKEGWSRKKIFKAMYNVFEGKDEGLQLAQEWARGYKDLDPSYDDEYFAKKYKLYSSCNYLSVVTLQELARYYSPREYKAWFDNTLLALILEAARRRTPVAVAEAAAHFLRTRFTCIRGSWYQHTGAYLKHFKFNRTTISLFVVRIRSAAEQESGPKRGSDYNYEALLKQLESTGFLSSVKIMLTDIFTSRCENVLLDSGGRLFPTASTYVYEMKKNRGAVARRGLLEDFFVSHSECNHNTSFTTNDVGFQKERKFAKELFRDSDIIDYIDRKRTKDFLAPSGEKTIEVHMGPPNSAKTTSIKCDKRMFGALQFGHSPSVITGTSNSSGPTPETAHTNNRKRVTAEDPESTDEKKPNEAWLIRESGYSNRMSRFLNDNGGDQEACANIILLLNDPIHLSPTTQMQVRVLVFMYLARYLSLEDAETMKVTIPDTYEEQYAVGIYPRINFSQEDYIEYGTARLNYCFLLAQEMSWKDTLPRPLAIRNMTKAYWDTYDPYSHFAKVYLVPDRKAKLHIDVFYPAFIQWYKKKYHVTFGPRLGSFTACIKGVLHTDRDSKDYYHGYRLEDPVFREFIENCILVAEPSTYLDAKTAWAEFRGWLSATNVKTHIDSFQQFIAYMNVSDCPYTPGLGFQGRRTASV